MTREEAILILEEEAEFLYGDTFVMPHPLLGITEEAWERFKEWEK